MGVLEMPDGYNSLEQILKNTTTRLRKRYGWMVMLAGIIFLGLLYGTYCGLRFAVGRMRG
jgi:hypothetical protein